MMNHCNELSLSKFMSRQKSLPLDVVLQLCRDIATALHFLHEVKLYYHYVDFIDCKRFNPTLIFKFNGIFIDYRSFY